MRSPLNRSVETILYNHPWEKRWSGLKRLARRRILVILCFGLLSLTFDDPNGSPFQEWKEDALSKLPLSIENQELRSIIPPHSVVFVTVQRWIDY